MSKPTKEQIFAATNFEELMEEHDPFAIKDEKGKIKFFKTYEDVYYFVLMHLFYNNRRGYVDLVLLVSQLTKLTIKESETVVADMHGLWGKEDALIIPMPWIKEFEEQTEDLKNLFKCLHLITETKFNEYDFDSALARARLSWIREIAREKMNKKEEEEVVRI